MPFKLSSCALLAISACSGALAAEVGSISYHLNGFATAGVVHSSEKQADFAAVLSRPHGAGYTKTWSPDVDSRIGAQLDASLTPDLTAVVQLVSE